MSKLLLIDGNSLTYRAYFGSAYGPRGILTTKDGIPTNAVLTLNRMIQKALDKYRPTHVLVAFDAGKQTHRHEHLDSYKGGRSATPVELIQQFPLVKEMLSHMGVKTFQAVNYEADDIIATAAKLFTIDEVLVLSSDKDLLQLVDDRTSIILPQNGQNPDVRVSMENFFEKYGCTPNKIPDLKGIMGDSSDNLPGVKGIGPKGALKLLEEFNTLEGIYENIDQIKGSTKTKLEESKDMALLCKKLATLVFDMELPFVIENLTYSGIVTQDLIDFFDRYELVSLKRRYKVEENVNLFENLDF